MNFTQAAALATAWVDRMCAGALVVQEWTLAKPYGWGFFYDSKKFLETGDWRYRLGGNAPILINKYTSELHVIGAAQPLEHYITEYEKSLPPTQLQGESELPHW